MEYSIPLLLCLALMPRSICLHRHSSLALGCTPVKNSRRDRFRPRSQHDRTIRNELQYSSTSLLHLATLPRPHSARLTFISRIVRARRRRDSRSVDLRYECVIDHQTPVKFIALMQNTTRQMNIRLKSCRPMHMHVHADRSFAYKGNAQFFRRPIDSPDMNDDVIQSSFPHVGIICSPTNALADETSLVVIA